MTQWIRRGGNDRVLKVLGASMLTLWFAWAWVRLLPPKAIRHTLLQGVDRLVPVRAHFHLTIASGGQTSTLVTHWQFFWHHVIVVPPTLRIYHQWAYQHLAYSDIISLYGAHQLYTHALPYVTTPIEYPVLLGVFMWIMAWMPTVMGYFLVTGVVLWASALGTYLFLFRWNRRLALAFACMPLFFVYGLLNWDIVGIFLMILAIDRYHQQHFDAAALLFAAAVFFKFFPIFYLPFMWVDLSRRGQRRVRGRMVWIFVIAAAVINLPFMLTNWWNWSLFYAFNAGRGIGADIWSNAWVHMHSVPVIDLVSLVFVLGAMILAGRQVGRSLSADQAAAITFAAFLIVNKVYSPQYTLWMVVFAVVAEWPLWTILLMSAMGVMDYANSFTVLKLEGLGTGAYYAGHIFPLGIALRYLTLLASLVGVLLGRPALHHWGRGHMPRDVRRII